ncbi:preprotein translocase subunit SecG [Hyphomicrobium sp. CS1GBMeth3]|uniref:preprotein translocase subunit SecG n=1 Tax=Hyphomicrobium sp. CS1GBMeth3 TaxID=1892845 RepID=UPI0009308481|nr:preprotein translocase subunit SecG [Hyphomicrobium sp. CS1GBMeth3]
MTTVLLVLHIMVAAALVAVVLWQRSEGGALGIGGGGGAGGFLTGRGTANLLTRTTAILAACFFLTSIALTLVSKRTSPVGSHFDAPASSTTAPAAPAQEGQPAAPAAPSDGAPRGGILDKLR